MNIQILEPEQFISLNKEMYIKKNLFEELNESSGILVAKNTEDPAITIKSEMALSPSNLEIEIYLQNNHELRNLALELDLIYMRDAESMNYLNYCNSYN